MKRIPTLAGASALSALLLISAVAQAQVKANSDPVRLVTTLYRQHNRNHSPFYQTRSRARVNQYFEKSLADLIWKDSVGNKGEAGALDADPLYDAQDTQIKNFSVKKSGEENGRTVVVVSFENFGEKQQLVFLLAQEKIGWKIADIKYKDGRTLSGILKGS